MYKQENNRFWRNSKFIKTCETTPKRSDHLTDAIHLTSTTGIDRRDPLALLFSVDNVRCHGDGWSSSSRMTSLVPRFLLQFSRAAGEQVYDVLPTYGDRPSMFRAVHQTIKDWHLKVRRASSRSSGGPISADHAAQDGYFIAGPPPTSTLPAPAEAVGPISILHIYVQNVYSSVFLSSGGVH